MSFSDKENTRNANTYIQTNNADTLDSKATKAVFRPKNEDKACWQGAFEGWLSLKQGSWLKSEWKEVWCVIGTEGNMHMFSDTDAPKPIHVFPLHSTMVKDLIENESKRQFEISLECPKKKLSTKVRCNSKTVKSKWMAEIRKAVQRPNKSSMSQFEVSYKEATDLNIS